MDSQVTRPRQRSRKLGPRIFAIFGYSMIALGLAWFFESQATTTVIFVRHADTDVTMAEGGDPPLNARGRARAEKLADFLQDIDVVAGVNAIYASPARRTQETAEPLARRLGLPVAIQDPYDYDGFMSEVLSEHKGQIVLIVTHKDAIAPLIDELHGSKRLPPIADEEYDNLYIVTIPWGGGAKVKTLRLRYPGPEAEVPLDESHAQKLIGSE
jgi:2,3-bisphosphoglycerate-dependent phosphoglycerate mutase